MADKDNNQKSTLGITVKKHEDMPEWYSQVILKAELADYSAIKGCMVIRPLGYAIWQKIMDFFNDRIKKHGVENAYFPMFIPESFFKKEAEHAEGFSPEVAWIDTEGKDTEERLALRPTSETIIYDSYSKWIRSYRDLPLKINQWCNIVRWEVKDVKPFLRGREFLWQEGHCVYETEDESNNEALLYLDEYKRVSEELLAVPAITGVKTDNEKFAGAKFTYAIESLMPDGKALQLGTTHNLGQGFAKVFDIKYIGKDEKFHHPWQNSWGFSTRLIGALVMMHGDDKGLVLPPSVAPTQVVIVPILFQDSKEAVLKKCKEMKNILKKFDVKLDDREEYKPGFKFHEWELKGVPLRIEFGPKDMEKGEAIVARRDTGEKQTIKVDKLVDEIPKILDNMQTDMFVKAKEFLKNNIVDVKDFKELMKVVKEGKMARAAFCCDNEAEDELKAESGGVTARCIPIDMKDHVPKEKCFYTGKDAKAYVLFARNY